MDHHSAPDPKPQEAMDSVPPGEEQPAQAAAHPRFGHIQADDRFDYLLGQIGEAMGDDWPEWVKEGLDPAP